MGAGSQFVFGLPSGGVAPANKVSDPSSLKARSWFLVPSEFR